MINFYDNKVKMIRKHFIKKFHIITMKHDFQLNDYELRKGKRIGVTISFNNHRLFVGNIPKNKDREELFEELRKHARKQLKRLNVLFCKCHVPYIH